MEQMSLDVLKLPMTSSGNNKALVAVDYLSKLLWFEPMQREYAITLSETFAKMFKNSGFPRTVITDQGTNMVSKLFEDLRMKQGISHNYTTHYHPMANGEVERTHRTILSQLTTSMTESGEDWTN
ncbi:MAG: transposase family protein [bacterium]|nr:transposase family protein [bacterium]